MGRNEAGRGHGSKGGSPHSRSNPDQLGNNICLIMSHAAVCRSTLFRDFFLFSSLRLDGLMA